MTRRLFRGAVALVSAALLASCADSPVASDATVAPPRQAISDGARGGQPEFFWLEPTVRGAPTPQGTFDAGALNELAVEVCALDANSACVGPAIERLDATSTPPISRLTLDVRAERYELRWLAGNNALEIGKAYRLSVKWGMQTLGFVDVMIVLNSAEIALIDASKFTPLVFGQTFPVYFRLEQRVARNYVKINEVESNGGTPGDWVELYNTGTVPFDLSGYVFRDNDDTRGYTLPAGTIIEAGGYLVLDEAQFGFGLGGADAARLFAAGGTVVVDSYSWTAHAATTYGRCPSGTGSFVTNTTSTKGAANDCSIAVRINEVESNGGTPGDWVEFFNAGPAPVDLGGYVFRDNSMTGYVIPAGTVIAAGGYLVLDELINGAGNFTFGLGAADQARLFAPGGITLVDSYEWTAHATTTYGRCPTGTGPFTTTGASTKGAANNCGALALAVKINEIESNGGTPGDWVELFNTGTTTADLSGYVFRDNATTGGYVLPTGTTLAPGAYLVLEEAQFGFGLGGADQAQLFAPGGIAVIDSYTWSAHASTTYGRCPNGTGDFTTTLVSTKGAANDCAAPPTFFAWPGDATVVTETFGGTTFGGNMSGLAYQASGTATPGVIWAVRNGPGALFRLVWTGSAWARDAANDWGAGKLLRYPNGAGDVDAEGVALVGTAIYVASERNNASNAVSRNSILRYDPSASGATLTATIEWDLTADLPANGANLGLEGITFVPDTYLVARGFRVQGTNAVYNPASYPDHGDGLFFVGVEATGAIHAYALNHVTGSFTRLATFTSGFPAVMELAFDRELNQLWAVCDNGCEGRSTVLSIDTQTSSTSLGTFVVTQRFERPTGMPNLNNEGFTLAPQAECVNGRKPVFWADDTETGGVSLRRGLVSCTAFGTLTALRAR